MGSPKVSPTTRCLSFGRACWPLLPVIFRIEQRRARTTPVRCCHRSEAPYPENGEPSTPSRRFRHACGPQWCRSDASLLRPVVTNASQATDRQRSNSVQARAWPIWYRACESGTAPPSHPAEGGPGRKLGGSRAHHSLNIASKSPREGRRRKMLTNEMRRWLGSVQTNQYLSDIVQVRVWARLDPDWQTHHAVDRGSRSQQGQF
jgi:hypothetical protein